MRSLVRRIRAEGYDFVHTTQSKAGAIGRLAAAYAGTPHILHSLAGANFGQGFGRASELFRAAEHLTARRTQAYFAVGADVRDRFLAAGISRPAAYRIVRSSIALDRFDGTAGFTQTALDLPDDALVVAYVGILERRKGVLQLPELLGRLQSLMERDVVLVVAGDGDLRNTLDATFDSLGLSG